jgi:hypothetical protein
MRSSLVSFRAARCPWSRQGPESPTGGGVEPTVTAPASASAPPVTVAREGYARLDRATFNKTRHAAQ